MGKWRAWLDLTSTRPASILIALLFVQLLVSAIIPQHGAEGLPGAGAGESGPGWHRIRTSPVFLATLGLLAVNLTAGNIKRFRRILRTEGTLLQARHLGSILFHLALLLVIAGVVLHGLYRFDGVFGLTEGQTVRDVPAAYFRIFAGPLHRTGPDRFGLALERVDPQYPVGGTVTEAAFIRIEPADGGEALHGAVHTNHPLRWRDLEFHFGSTVGFSPELVVADAEGRELFRRFVRLKRDGPDDERRGEDFIVVPGHDLRVDLRVDASEAPGCRLRVSQGRVDLFAGLLGPQDEVAAGEYRISVPRLRSWCYVHAIANPWLPVVFTGFWLALAGLAVRAVAETGIGKGARE